MPLYTDLWSQGKCGLKILQYYGVGLPAVCTPVGINRDIVEDGQNGFWALNADEWKSRLLKLMQEEGLRKEMGVKGRRTVERSFCLEVNAPRMLDTLLKVGGAVRTRIEVG